MPEFLKENFKKTNECIILVIPLTLFVIITQWYLFFISDYLNSGEYIIQILITLWVWFSGFFAAWFYMVKKTVEFSNNIYPYQKDKDMALLKLFKALYKGIGRLFIPMLAVILCIFAGSVIKWFITAFMIIFLPVNLKAVFILKVLICYLVLYWFIFWIPEIVYCKKNPFKALWPAIMKSAKTIKKIGIIYTIFYIICSVIFYVLIFSINIQPIFYFFIFLFIYYFIIYSVLAIFRYYEQNFVG